LKEDKHYTFWGIPFILFFQFWSCHVSQKICSAVVTNNVYKVRSISQLHVQ